MPTPTSADVSWVDVLPSMKSFLPTLQKELGNALPAAGRNAGTQFGSGFSQGAVGQVEAASAKMSAALRKVQDATGQVNVAEARLQQLRDSGKATNAQLVTAQENLARSLRNETGANEGLTSATRRMAEAQNAHTTAARAGGTAMDDGTKKAGVLSRAFGGLHGAVITGLSAFYAVQGAVNFIGGAIAAARDLGETVNKSNVIFGVNAARIDEWAKTAARSLGLSRQAALESAAQFGNMYTQLGFSADAAADMSIRTVQMAADLGSFNNLPTSDVAERIAAGFRGEYDSLQLLIPNISAARVESEAMAMSGKTNADSLTAQEKASAVLAIVQKDGSKAMGDFARTSDGLANSQRILSAEWDNAKARLGEFLVGPATGFVHFLTDAIPKVMSFGRWFGDNLGTIAAFTGVFAGLVAVTYAHNTAMAISAAGGMAQWLAQTRLVTAASSAWTAVQWLLNASIMGFPLVWIVAAFVAVGAAVYALWTRSETFRDIVLNVWDAVQKAISWAWEKVIKPAFEGITVGWSYLSTGLQWGWQNVIQPTWTFLQAAAQEMWGILRPIFEAIGIAWSIMVSVIKDLWDHLLYPLWNLVVTVAKGMYELLQPIFTLIGVAWQVLMQAFQLYWDIILHPLWLLVSTVAEWLWKAVLAPIFTLIGEGWKLLMEGMRWAYDHVIHPMWGILEGAINGTAAVFAGAVDAIKAVWNTLMSVAATPVNFIMHWVLNDGLLKAWNSVMGWIGLDNLKVGLLSPIHVNGATPGWAAGGMIPGKYIGPTADNVPGYVPMSGGGAMPIRVNPREFIEPVSAVDRYGVDFMEAVRTGRFPLELARGFAPGGQMTYPRLTQWAFANLKNPVITSGYRPGAKDYHGQGMAVDISNAGNGQPLNQEYARKIAAAFGNITELIHNPNASIKNGRQVPPSFWGAATWAQHANHVHWAMTPEALGSAGMGSSLGGAFRDAAEVYSTLKDSIKRATEVVGNSSFMAAARGLPGVVLGKMWDLVKGQVGSFFARGTTPDGDNTAPAGLDAVKAAVQSVFATRGWGGGNQWAATDWLVRHESSWNPKAQNPTSTASGLFQHVNGTWIANRPVGATATRMRDATITQQAQAGMKYIATGGNGARPFRDPLGAKSFWETHHWYGQGGPVVLDDGGWAPPGWWFNGTGDVERVLSPEQTRSFDRLVDSLEYGDPRVGGHGPHIDHVSFHTETVSGALDELEHRLEVWDLGGKYVGSGT